MLDADDILAKLASARGPVEMTFDNGERTTLVPVRLVPQLDRPDRRRSLGGEWRVARWPFAADEAALAAPGTDDATWPTVAQPGKVFCQRPEVCPGEVANWNRIRLDHIHERDGAVLRRRVVVPPAWAGRRIFLRFDAIYPAGRVYLNGELLGEHLSGLTPVEWDVTGRVRPGEQAVVAVRLLRKHPYVDLDMPRHGMEFAGLAQDAYFHCIEPCHVADYHLLTELDDSFSGGSMSGRVWVANCAEIPRFCTLSAVLTDRAGAVVARTSQSLDVPAGGSAEVSLRLEAADIECWSDESPVLYTVTVRLEVVGQEPQETSHRTGFRRLALSPAGARLNGGFVKFRGVNHLTFHPEHGLHTPKDWLRRCLTMMKRANVNAIRTHYHAPPDLADLCDEMGFYLMQELPIDWASHHLVTRACLGPVLLRVESGLRRDRHHPSLMAWSIGNENLPTAGGDAEVFWSNMKLLDRLAKTLAPATATMFPPPGPAGKIDGIFEARVGDLADTHYSFRHVRRLNETGATAEPLSWKGDYVARSRQELLARGWSGVWLSSEWGLFNFIPDLLNAPYSSLIADEMEDPLSGRNTQQVFLDRFRREWSYMRDDPTCLGGAFFPWMCAGSGDPWGWTLWGEDADWGVVTHDLLPKPSFWAMRVAYSPVLLPDRVVWRPGQAELKLRVRSFYHRTDLAQCTFRTQMGGGPPYMGMLRDWKDVPASCPPGGSAEVTVPIWSEDSRKALGAGQPIVCRCTVLDPGGYRPITHDVLVVPERPAGQAEPTAPIGARTET